MHRSFTADVAIWGRVPPPIGGMTMHLRRLLPYLTDAEITFQMYSIGRQTPDHPLVKQVSGNRLRWLIGLLFRECEPVHYVLSSSTVARFLASLLALFRRAEVVLRIGGESLRGSINSSNVVERLMIRFAIRNASVIIGVNQDICLLARKLGAKRVVHAPGFIPEVRRDTTVPKEVAAFIEAAKGPLLLAAGEVRDPSEDDFYGAYLLLDAIEKLPTVRVVFYAYKITRDGRPQQKFADEIRRRELQDRYLLYCSATDLLPAMHYCHVFVRPVLSDGDSNSIREALYLGIPVVASNCVERPQGVVSFSMGDPTELTETLASVLNDLEEIRHKLCLLPKQDHSTQVVALFHELLRRHSIPPTANAECFSGVSERDSTHVCGPNS